MLACVRACVCVQERERQRERESVREGGKERECDNTTKWDHEGIRSCSCVPIAPPGNILFHLRYQGNAFLNHIAKTKYCCVIIGNVTMVNY